MSILRQTLAIPNNSLRNDLVSMRDKSNHIYSIPLLLADGLEPPSIKKKCSLSLPSKKLCPSEDHINLAYQLVKFF